MSCCDLSWLREYLRCVDIIAFCSFYGLQIWSDNWSISLKNYHLICNARISCFSMMSCQGSVSVSHLSIIILKYISLSRCKINGDNYDQLSESENEQNLFCHTQTHSQSHFIFSKLFTSLSIKIYCTGSCELFSHCHFHF